jgi:single-strand DNA-binding protein
MSYLNKVLIIGNVGRDPEVRTTQGGGEVATFSVATNEKWKDKNGDPQERTEWHNIVTFGKSVKNVKDLIKKGSQVFVEGKLQTDKWEDKEGNKRSKTSIMMFSFSLLGGKPKSKDSGPADYSDSDVPF